MSLVNSFSLIVKRFGHQVTLLRDSTGDSVTAYAMRRGFSPQELVSNEYQQGDVKLRLIHTELVNSTFPVPPIKGDRIDDNGSEFTVKSVTPLMVSDNMVGYELNVRG